MRNYSTFCWWKALAFSILSTIVASIALAGEPRPPSCLSTDGSTPEPGDTCCDASPTAYADENGSSGNGTVIGQLVPRSDTFHSIGFVWDIDGDADHDGTVSIRYRKAGACNFSPAMPLIRNDYAWFWHDDRAAEPTNNFAGSLMFLTPGTTYEVVLELNDPDGGRAMRVRELTTRAIPRKPTSGRTLHVVPGSGGGDGSSGNPFRGLGAANAAARPGDTFLLHAGTYSRATLSNSGAEGNHVVYEPAGDGTPIVHAMAITGDHIWVDRLTFVWNGNGTHWSDVSGLYVPGPSSNNPDDIIITNNDISGFDNGIISYYRISRWVVMDNTLVGRKPVGIGGTGKPGDSTGRGIALGGENTPGGPGNIIAYNSITRYSDALGSSGDSDVYGNQAWDLEDDCLSNDGSFSNVRVWGNRLHFCAGNVISFQPQKAGPWYFLYNQMADGGLGIWKWRVQDRNVFVNNTFMQGTSRGHYFMKGVLRNNLFIGGGPIWSATDTSDTQPTIQAPPQWEPSWNTDVDYDGFDWGRNGTAFSWRDGTETYRTISGFAAAVGIEQNAIEVDRNQIFENYAISPTVALTLDPSGNAVDAGVYVPNLADFFKGGAPDLGAYETGAEPLHFGPRSGSVLHERELHWAKH